MGWLVGCSAQDENGISRETARSADAEGALRGGRRWPRAPDWEGNGVAEGSEMRRPFFECFFNIEHAQVLHGRELRGVGEEPEGKGKGKRPSRSACHKAVKLPACQCGASGGEEQI